MNKKWTKEQEAFIYQNSVIMSDDELLREFHSRFCIEINIDRLRKKRQRMGIKKKSGRGVIQVVGLIKKPGGCSLTIKGV